MITWDGNTYESVSDLWEAMHKTRHNISFSRHKSILDCFLQIFNTADTAFVDLPVVDLDSQVHNNLRSKSYCTDLMTRLIYRDTEIATADTTKTTFALAMLSGVSLPPNTVVGAAAGIYTGHNDSRVYSWLHWLYLLRVPFSVDGKPISDSFGNSILEVMSAGNTKYVLQSLLASGVTSVHVTNGCAKRIKQNPNKTVQRLLKEFEFLIIDL